MFSTRDQVTLAAFKGKQDGIDQAQFSQSFRGREVGSFVRFNRKENLSFVPQSSRTLLNHFANNKCDFLCGFLYPYLQGPTCERGYEQSAPVFELPRDLSPHDNYRDDHWRFYHQDFIIWIHQRTPVPRFAQDQNVDGNRSLIRIYGTSVNARFEIGPLPVLPYMFTSEPFSIQLAPYITLTSTGNTFLPFQLNSSELNIDIKISGTKQVQKINNQFVWSALKDLIFWRTWELNDPTGFNNSFFGRAADSFHSYGDGLRAYDEIFFQFQNRIVLLTPSENSGSFKAPSGTVYPTKTIIGHLQIERIHTDSFNFLHTEQWDQIESICTVKGTYEDEVVDTVAFWRTSSHQSVERLIEGTVVELGIKPESAHDLLWPQPTLPQRAQAFFLFFFPVIIVALLLFAILFGLKISRYAENRT